MVPSGKHIWETLFHIAHDKLGHFGTPKTYKALRHSFYWPHMHRYLEDTYILACAECQQNKSKVMKPISPLHPLPIPDQCCNSVAIDFIRPLPLENSFNSIVTFTNRLGSNIRIIPTSTSLTAEQLARLFFNECYCENCLPLDIILDCDKLFASRFWKAFT